MWGLSVIAPYYYGNPIYLEKFTYLEDSNGHNLVFMGSSRTLRQLNPVVVDSVIPEMSQSFNLGAGGTFGLQVLYTAEHLLLNSKYFPSLEVLVVEIQLPQPILDINMHTPRSKYFLDQKRYETGANFIRAYYPDEIADTYIQNFRSSRVERILNIGLVRAQLYSLIPRRGMGHFLGERGDGFVPLDDELPKRSYVERRAEFVDNLEHYRENFEQIRKNEDMIVPRDVGELYIQAHLDLITIGETRDVKVVFALMPSGFNVQQNGSRSIFERIPANNRIDVGSYQKWPWLYDTSNYFDRGHLNEGGANKFSRALALELRLLMNQKTVN